MKNIKNIVLPEILTLSPIAVGLFLWNRLPDPMATHFDMNGMPDGFSSKAFTVFAIPMILAVLLPIGQAVTEKKADQQKQPKQLLRLIPWLIPAVSLMMYTQLYSYALNRTAGQASVVMAVVSVFVGVILTLFGNYMPKVRQNRTLGIKLPWTLSSEENWNKTHRFAGPVWVVCGIVLAVGGGLRLLPSAALLVIILIVVAVPTIYSFLLSLKEKKGESQR